MLRPLLQLLVPPAVAVVRGYSMVRRLGRRPTRPMRRQRRLDWHLARMEAKLDYKVRGTPSAPPTVLQIPVLVVTMGSPPQTSLIPPPTGVPHPKCLPSA